MDFNDRRPVSSLPTRKADLHGHLINDHEHLRDGVGSTRPPTKARLSQLHDELHARGGAAGHKHFSSDDAALQRHFDSHSGDQAECRDAACQAATRWSH